MKRAAVCAIVGLLLYGANVQAYLKLGSVVGGNIVSLKWGAFPVRYFISNHDVPGVSAPQLRDAVGRAFASWEAVPNTGMSSQFAGFTAASPLDDDNLSVIGFANRPDLDRVLGSTSFTLDVVSGQIVESDIFLNSTFAWSVAADGQAGAYDVESIALHEIGHLHGLGHSALGETQLMGTDWLVLAAEAVMFPVAFSAGSVNSRTLRADDIAGISDSGRRRYVPPLDRQHQRTHHEERCRCLRGARRRLQPLDRQDGWWIHSEIGWNLRYRRSRSRAAGGSRRTARRCGSSTASSIRARTSTSTSSRRSRRGWWSCRAAEPPATSR